MKRASLILLLLLTSCRSDVGDINTVESVELLQTNIKFNFNKSHVYHIRNRVNIAYSYSGKKETFFFLDKNNSTMDVFIKENDEIKLSKTQNLYRFFLDSNTKPESFVVINSDSILFLSKEYNALLFTNSNFKPIGRMTIKCRNPNYLLHTFTQPLYYYKHNVYLLQSPDLDIFNNKNDLAKYYTIPSGVVFDFTSATPCLHEVGKYPEYITGSNNYNVFNPNTCVNDSGNYLFSFGPFDSIYEFTLANKKRIYSVKSKYHSEPVNFPSSQLNDDKYSYKYLLKTGQYKDLIYDVYKNVYYRVYLHGIYTQNNNELPSPSDKEWSLMVLDKKLKVIGERKFAAKFDPNTIIVTKYGILVSSNRNMSELYEPRVMNYSLFILKNKKNEK